MFQYLSLISTGACAEAFESGSRSAPVLYSTIPLLDPSQGPTNRHPVDCPT